MAGPRGVAYQAVVRTGTGTAGRGPARTRVHAGGSGRPAGRRGRRHRDRGGHRGARAEREPRNLDFADGLDGWIIGGSSLAEVTGSHWADYAVGAADGAATLSAAVADPYGNVFLGQEVLADGYRGATVTLRAEVRGEDVADHAELSLAIVSRAAGRGQERDGHANPGGGPRPGLFPQRRQATRDVQRHGETITGSTDWTRYEVAAQVPDEAEHIEFDLTLAGTGLVGLRHVELTRR